MDTKEVERAALQYARLHLSQDAIVEHVSLAGVTADHIMLNVKCVSDNQAMTILVRSEFTLHNAKVVF